MNDTKQIFIYLLNALNVFMAQYSEKELQVNDCASHEKSMNFHDPWVGTDTPGPGEVDFAIGSNGQPYI